MRAQMAMRMSRHTTAIILILVAATISCNRNKKVVKGEVIGPEDLCELGRFLSAEAAVEDLHLMPPAVMLSAAADAEIDKPRAIVQGLHRSLLGSGAHREVHSAVAVELDLGLELLETSVADDCDLVLLEPLSNGVFADPFQLNRLQQNKAVKYAQVYGDVDLERPARNSFESIVELHQRLVPDKRNGLEVLYRSEVTIPLHARYPPVSTESHFLVNISIPHVLIYCRAGDNATGKSVKLKEDRRMYALFSETVPKRLQWPIPSGFPSHSAWVARLTTFSALVGVVAVFIASKFHTLK